MSENKQTKNTKKTSEWLIVEALSYFNLEDLKLAFFFVWQHARWAAVRDIIDFWPEWVFHLVLVAVHLVVTFGLHVPGCPMYVHRLLVNPTVSGMGGLKLGLLSPWRSDYPPSRMRSGMGRACSATQILIIPSDCTISGMGRVKQGLLSHSNSDPNP